jgi:hypothetical protein
MFVFQKFEGAKEISQSLVLEEDKKEVFQTLSSHHRLLEAIRRAPPRDSRQPEHPAHLP